MCYGTVVRCLFLFIATSAIAQNCTTAPARPKQGDVIRLTCSGDVTSARMNGFTIRLFPHQDGNRLGLMPVTVDEKPGIYAIEFLTAKSIVNQSHNVTIADAHFLSQNIVLGKQLAELQPSLGEYDTVAKFKQILTEDRRWAEPFLPPVPGCITSPYGVHRLHNGKPTGNYHTGLDQRTPAGKPIRAIAGGDVRLAGHFNLHGNTVGVDHGQGLESIYLHMSQLAVKDGDTVNRGDVLGYAGSTGRSTAPHLHWNLYVNGIPVNPLQWVSLKPCAKPAKHR